MEHSNPLKRLLHLIALERREIGSIYFYAILSGLVQLSVPVGVQAIIGFVMGATLVTSIYVLTFLVVAGVLVVGILQINQMKIIEKIQQNIFTRNAFEFADKIPRFDLMKVDNYYLPEKVNRFFDTINVQKGLSKLLLDIPTATIQIIFSLLLLSLYHPLFIAFGAMLVLTIWLILKLTGKKGLATSFTESKYKYAAVAWMQEMARAIKSFKFSQGTHLNLQKTDKFTVGYLNARNEHFQVLLFQYRTLVVLKVAITAAMLMVGTYLLLSQQLNIGEFIAAEIVILTVIAAVEKLIGSLDGMYDVITGLEKLSSVTEIPLEHNGPLDYTPSTGGTRIDLIDFSFSYPDGKRVIKFLNASIKPGSIVCISGPEGSGKSTLLKILSGNYTDFNGSLLINNIPLNNYNHESLRAKTGVYLNQQELFTGTVLENISLGKKNITPEMVTHLSEQTGIQIFTHTLMSGYETEIDPTGKKLPGTLIQKILLLRALVNQPNILLLEEPWNGLEPECKTSLISYLLKNPNNATILISSNDPDFAEKADYHIQLSNGLATVIVK